MDIPLDPSNPKHLITLDDIKACRSLQSVEGKPGTVLMFLENIRRLDLRSALLKVASSSATLVKQKLLHDQTITITRENMSLLAKGVLLESVLQGGKEPTDAEMNRLCLILNDATGDSPPREGETTEVFLEQYLIRKSQFAGLDDPLRNVIPRTIIIYEELGKKYADQMEVNVPKAFEEITGISIREHVFLGFAFFTIFQNGGTSSLAQFKGEQLTIRFKAAEKFVQKNSATPEELRKQGWSAEKLFEFNPLLAHPIIRLGDSDLICPFLPFLHDRMTRGVYYILLDALGEPFTHSLGYLFEKYVGSVLAPFFPEDCIFQEREYLRGKNVVLTVDWGVKEGHWLTLLECKTKRLRQKQTKETGDFDALDRDLELGVVDALVALNRQMEDMRKYPDQFAEYKDVFHIIPMVVLIDRLHFTYSPMLERRIRRLLKEKHGIEMGEFHIVDIEELETMLPVAKLTGGRRTLRSLLQKKQGDLQYRHQSVWNYIARAYPQGIRTNQELKKKFDAIFSETKKYLFGPQS